MIVEIEGSGNNIKTKITMLQTQLNIMFAKYCTKQLGASYKIIDGTSFLINGEHNDNRIMSLYKEFKLI